MSGKQQVPQRPLSPHLMIYKPQISSVLSITHRITGFGLFIGALLLAWWIVLTVYGCTKCINPLIFSVPGKTFLVLWTLALYYHMLNGIRHLFWDAGKGFQLCAMRKSGYAVIFGAGALTVLSWMAGQWFM